MKITKMAQNPLTNEAYIQKRQLSLQKVLMQLPVSQEQFISQSMKLKQGHKKTLSHKQCKPIF